MGGVSVNKHSATLNLTLFLWWWTSQADSRWMDAVLDFSSTSRWPVHPWMWLHAIHGFSLTIAMRCFCKDTWKRFQLYFPFTPWRRYQQVHQVRRNYPSSITFSQLWPNSSQLARLFKVTVALSPDLNTVRWSLKWIYRLLFKTTRALVGVLQ